MDIFKKYYLSIERIKLSCYTIEAVLMFAISSILPKLFYSPSGFYLHLISLPAYAGMKSMMGQPQYLRVFVYLRMLCAGIET